MIAGWGGESGFAWGRGGTEFRDLPGPSFMDEVLEVEFMSRKE